MWELTWQIPVGKAKDPPDLCGRHLQGWARGRYPLLPQASGGSLARDRTGPWPHFIRNQGDTLTECYMPTAFLPYVAPSMQGGRHTYLTGEEKFLLRLSAAKRKALKSWTSRISNKWLSKDPSPPPGSQAQRFQFAFQFFVLKHSMSPRVSGHLRNKRHVRYAGGKNKQVVNI